MNPEQVKVHTFLDKFIIVGTRKFGVKMGMVISIFFILISCIIPVQDLVAGEGNKLASALPIAISVFGAMAGFARILPYETYAEKHNNMGSAMDLLEYHPISKMELAKVKIRHIIRFLAKLSFVCLGVQLLSAYVTCGMVSWINVGYIFLFAFLIPVIYECVPRWLRAKFNYGGKS